MHKKKSKNKMFFKQYNTLNSNNSFPILKYQKIVFSKFYFFRFCRVFSNVNLKSFAAVTD